MSEVNSDDLDEYSYLWDGTEPGWRLFPLGADPDGATVYIILNTTESYDLIIEDNATYDKVKAKMLSAGRVYIEGNEV